jgi:exodeoxyribonuclease VII large subunit
LSERLSRSSPSKRIHDGRVRLAALSARVSELERARVASAQRAFHAAAARLDAMSPLKVMGRGYSVVFRANDGRLVRRAADVQAGDALRIRLAGSGCQALSECDEIDAQVTAARGPKGGSDQE